MKNKVVRLTKEQAQALLEANDGTFFSVEFIKRTTGERRKMLCRTGVPGKNGGVPAYNFHEKGLLCVYDVRLKAFRAIPFEGVEKLQIKGRGFVVK